MSIKHITVRGARQHNLKNINVEIPRNQLTVITGLSGSGKSSLAFDTIYAEGQRRYVESLSAYAVSFWINWKSRTLIRSKDCLRRFRLNRKLFLEALVRRSGLSRRFTIICACFFRQSDSRIASSAARRLRNSRRSKSWRIFWICPKANA